MQASLLILAAESAADIGQTKQAAQLLTQARNIVGRRIMSACEVARRLNYITALAQYQGGNAALGDEALIAALKIYKGFSPWLFQLGLTTTELAKGNLSSRNARTIFERLADDPTPADWVARPMDCMTVLSTPHHAVFEQWFDTISERNLDTALEVAERARRHRFYSSLPFGGRLLALRWLLEGPETALDNETQLQRQDLLARYPAYSELGKRVESLRTQLRQMPLVADKDTSDQFRKQSDLFDDLAKATSSQELILREIAVRREPANFVFPPIRKMKDVQAALPSGTVLLSVFAANKQLHAVLLSKDKYANWKVERPDLLEKKIVALFRAMGNYDGQREIPQTQFADKSWETASRELIDAFLKGSRLNFAQKFDELVVVPDGDIWYLPFEAVHVGDGKNTVPLLAKTRVRLRTHDRSGLRRTHRSRRITPCWHRPWQSSLARRAAEHRRLRGQIEVRVGQDHRAACDARGASPLYGTLLDGIVVLDDLGNNPPSPLDWSPLPIDRQKQAGALTNWMALPWKSTDFLVFTGFHTPCENGLKDGSIHGQDLFLASCGLMATGARTVLLSRWRTGGQSSRELVRQFVQELPYSTAAESWQRAVQLVKESPLDLAYEPRVRRCQSPVINGAHPFFWGGFMVFDSGVTPHSAEAPPAEAPPAEPPALKLEAKDAKDAAQAIGEQAGPIGLESTRTRAKRRPQRSPAARPRRK